MSSENSTEEIIKEKIIKETAQSFSRKIEELVWNKDISYMEALEEMVESGAYEIEGIQKLITKDLLSKITLEAEDKNLIKKTTNRLLLV